MTKEIAPRKTRWCFNKPLMTNVFCAQKYMRQLKSKGRVVTSVILIVKGLHYSSHSLRRLSLHQCNVAQILCRSMTNLRNCLPDTVESQRRQVMRTCDVAVRFYWRHSPGVIMRVLKVSVWQRYIKGDPDHQRPSDDCSSYAERKPLPIILWSFWKKILRQLITSDQGSQDLIHLSVCL